MKRHMVMVSVLSAVGLMASAVAIAAVTGVPGRSLAASARPTAASMCQADCQSDKRESAAPELSPHPQGTVAGTPVVEVMPAPNAQALSAGASAPFTIYLVCPIPGFTLNGQNWRARSPVKSMIEQGTNGYWYGSLRLDSGTSATFRDTAGDVIAFMPGPASTCLRHT